MENKMIEDQTPVDQQKSEASSTEVSGIKNL